jgi:hypothetical protein
MAIFAGGPAGVPPPLLGTQTPSSYAIAYNISYCQVKDWLLERFKNGNIQSTFAVPTNYIQKHGRDRKINITKKQWSTNLT